LLFFHALFSLRKRTRHGTADSASINPLNEFTEDNLNEKDDV